MNSSTHAFPSIAAGSGLTTPANPNSGQKSQFALFSDSWLELQAYVGAASEMPITQGDFEQKYGKVGGSATITDCIGAMKKVKEASTEFGDPKALRAALIANPNLLATPEPPSEIYTHTVWLGQRVNETAGKLVSGYTSVLDGLSGLPPQEQVANLKAYLFDQTLGPIPLSKQMSDEVGVLIKKLGVFEQKMNEYNEKLQAFTRGSSKMMAELNSTLGALAQKIADLEKSRDAAYKAWRDFTIAAVATSVGCVLLGGLLAPFTGGLSLLVGGAAAIASGVGLGIKAAQCREEYNGYCEMLATEEAERKKKQLLRADLGGFDTQMQRVGPAMGKFLKNLQTLQGVWVQMNSDMLAIHNSVNAGNVGTLPFLVKAKAQLAVDSWKSVGDSARQFTVGSLVDYTSLAFGDVMPESAPQREAA
ncbi:alpha-xenorhabdolysin family binary toxin subunit A [Myxococcus sp. Y35]|uniref:alpha-xenorhabdolysin family binary toxin subunit A n=1 Tax=Pseudomyxococcus flavus TaxID=3115648 RepID=UPI003CF8A048